MPVERHWTVPEEQGPQITQTPEGDLLIQPRVVADGDGDALVESVFEAVAILRRVGGTIQIASQRAELAPGLVVTESYIVAYNSFTPLIRRLADEEQLAVPDQGNDDLTAEEIEQHFPPGGMDDVLEQARDETAAASDEEIRQEVGAVE